MLLAQRPTAEPAAAGAASRAARRPYRRLGFYLCAVLFGLAVLGASRPTTPPPGATPPPQPQPMGQAVAPAAAVQGVSPLDEPLRILARAQQAYQGVRDYACLLVKRERINGYLQPDAVMLMKVRTQPFAVYLRWQEPRNLRGQEACYAVGRYDGQMRVRPKGLLGAVGFVSLDPNDPRVRESSRHSITEAGLGNLIERFARGWTADRQVPNIQVRIAEYEYNKRRCTRVETIHPLKSRSVVYFDKENALPIRVELYEGLSSADDPGQLVEVYSYVNLHLNVGLGDDVFNH